MKKHVLLLLSLSLFALSACVQPTTRHEGLSAALVYEEEIIQKQIRIQNILDQRERLLRLSYPIDVANLEFCDDHVFPQLGMSYASNRILGKSYIEAATAMGLGSLYEIVSLVEGSVMHQAGLRKGDKFSMINGVEIEGYVDRAYEKAMESLEEYAEDYLDGKAVPDSFEVRAIRDGREMSFTVPLEFQCHYPMVITQDDILNAFTDGDVIIFTTGMLRFATDFEVQVIYAHELGHAAFQHIDAQQTNMAGGLFLDLIFMATTGVDPALRTYGANAYSQDFEIEADYVGVYFLARAGIDPAGAENFWRKSAAESDGGKEQALATTHPADSYRFVAIRRFVEEVKDKQARGLPLIPEMKEE